MGGKQVGSKNRAKQRRRRRLGILPLLTPLRQIQSAFAERMSPRSPFFSFAFIYAWVCMTFPAGEWANWQNLDSSTIKLLPVFSNVPALIVFGAVILAAEQWNRWLDSPPFLLGSGLAGSRRLYSHDDCSPFSEEKDVLFLVGCMVADFGTAPLTIALARSVFVGPADNVDFRSAVHGCRNCHLVYLLKYPSRLRTHDLRTSSSLCSLASSSRIPEK